MQYLRNTYHKLANSLLLKFMFSKKATKMDEIFTVNLTLCSKCQIDGSVCIFKSQPYFAAPQLSALQTMEMPLDGANTADS